MFFSGAWRAMLFGEAIRKISLQQSHYISQLLTIKQSIYETNNSLTHISSRKLPYSLLRLAAFIFCTQKAIFSPFPLDSFMERTATGTARLESKTTERFYPTETVGSAGSGYH
jgi:hypothetical protein